MLLGQLYGLTAREAASLTDYEANFLAESAKSALLNEAFTSPQMTGVVRMRAARVLTEVRNARLSRASHEGTSPVGPPPDES